jgi:S-adenosylmethionine hydrolase
VKVNDDLELDINGVVQKIRMSTTFSEVPEGALLCYRGSNNTLEIASNLASAKEILGVKVGDKISIW